LGTSQNRDRRFEWEEPCDYLMGTEAPGAPSRASDAREVAGSKEEEEARNSDRTRG
jgi:hypothetical protein